MTRLKILIVEDEMIIAWNLKRMLENLESEVISIASTAEKAVADARAGEPDLVLMDITLKGERNGMDAALEIREFSDVPIVYLTGNTNLLGDPELAKTRSQGMFGKPPTEAQLLEMLAIGRRGKP